MTLKCSETRKHKQNTRDGIKLRALLFFTTINSRNTNSAGNLSQCVQFDMVSSLTLLLLLLYCYCCLTYGSSGWLFPPEWSNGYESYSNNRILKETSE